jgi:hypothetical protein
VTTPTEKAALVCWGLSVIVLPKQSATAGWLKVTENSWLSVPEARVKIKMLTLWRLQRALLQASLLTSGGGHCSENSNLCLDFPFNRAPVTLD